MKKLFWIIIVLFLALTVSAQVGLTIKDAEGNLSRHLSCSSPFVAPLKLSAETPVLNPTDSYEVKPLSGFVPEVALNSGKPLNASLNNDKFFSTQDIGFNFCFYGRSFSKVVIGANGTITFDESYGGLNYPGFSQQNPNVNFPNYGVFGVMQALVFDEKDGADVYVQTIGTAPFRKMVINYYNARISGCNERTSSQIILSETVNTVTVYVGSKPLPCTESTTKNALIGIQNGEGTAGVSPPSRNTGIWSASNEAWVFVPNSAPLIPDIKWYDASGNVLGSGSSILLNNIIGLGNIKAEATFNVCSGEQKFSDLYEISLDPNYPTGQDYGAVICVPGTVSLADYIDELKIQNPGNFNIKFYKSQTEAQNGIGTEYTTDYITSNGVFYVRIENKTDTSCFLVVKLNIKLVSAALARTNASVCEVLKTNYQLSKLNSQIIDPAYTGGVAYFSDAGGTMPITEVNLTNGMRVWVKLDGCPDLLGPVTISLTSGPSVNTPLTYTAEMCDNNDDGVEGMNFNRAFDDKLVANPTAYKITYYRTLQDALTDVNIYSDVRKGKNPMYARVLDIATGCFSIAEIEMDIKFNSVTANDADVYFCFDGTSDRDITDLTTNPMYIEKMQGSGTVYYYDSKSSTASPITSIRLTKDGSFTTDAIGIKFVDSQGCYTFRELRFHQVNPTNYASNPIRVCDTQNDGTETVNLQNYAKDIAGDQNLTITFFQPGTTTPLTSSVRLTTGNNVFDIEMKSNHQMFDGSICVRRSAVTFALSKGPEVIKTPIVVRRNNECDNNNDGFELFDVRAQQPQIYSGSSSVSFEYYQNYDTVSGSFSNPYTLISDQFIQVRNNTPQTIFVKVTDLTTGCFSKAEIQVNYVFNTNTIVLHPAVLEQCVPYNTNVVVFNLSTAVSQSFIQSENSTPYSDLRISYYANYDPTTYTLSNPISTTYSPSGKSKKTVFVKYESSTTGCFSVAPIELITYLSPIAKNIIEPVCEYKGIFLNTLQDGRLLANGLDPSATYGYRFFLQDPLTNPQAAEVPSNVVFYPRDNQKVWFEAKVKSNQPEGCVTYGYVEFKIQPQMALTDRGPFIDNTTCDIGNDGKETVTSLRQFERTVKQQYPNAAFKYYETFPDKEINPDSYLASDNERILMVVTNGSDCPVAVPITIKLKKTPYFTVQPVYYYCENGGSVEIIADHSYFSRLGLSPITYIWELPDWKTITNSYPNSTLTVNTEGKYKLTIMADNDCAYTASFEAKKYDTPIIDRVVVEGNKVSVIATAKNNSRKIKYSYDGLGKWVDSYIFNDVPAGVRTFFVRYEDNNRENNCEGMPMQSLILENYNTITPNGDGYNDTWKIPHLDFFKGKSSTLKIFDRYNKMVFEQTGNTELSWNGTLNGRPLPTAAYWYVLKLPDGREITGWIMVKNTN